MTREDLDKYMGKLEGKAALITGGTSGIGLATAKAFVTQGASVFITGRRDSELKAAVKEIGRNVTHRPALPWCQSWCQNPSTRVIAHKRDEP